MKRLKGEVKWSGLQLSRTTFLSLLLIGFSVGTGWARTKYIVSPEIASAKTVYIENQTQDTDLLTTAEEELRKWGRFTVNQTKDNSDISIVFTHKIGIDKWGNASFIVMDVYVPSQNKPVFEAKNAVYVAIAPQHRTRACIGDFKKWLEPRH
jgi:hypothetical protein